MENEEIIKNGMVGTFGGYRLNGKTYDPNGLVIEEVHEPDCFCCRKDLFPTLTQDNK